MPRKSATKVPTKSLRPTHAVPPVTDLDRADVIRHLQRRLAEPVNDLPPTEVTSAPYLFADRQTGDYPPSTERSGKWNVFVPVDRLNEAWRALRAATEGGKLGSHAKVATMYPNPREAKPGFKVVCVYTYDGDDISDVMRVREELRRLGYVAKMGWKADSETTKGNYSAPGHRVSRYYE